MSKLLQRILLFMLVFLLAAVPEVYAGGGGKHKKKKEASDSPVPTMHPKAERNHHTVAKELRKGHSKAARVTKASHEPRSGHSKAPRVKKAKKGKNYTKHDNYP